MAVHATDAQLLRKKLIPPSALLQCALDIVAGMGYLHTKQYIHRDLAT
jgi:hypothetical protein